MRQRRPFILIRKCWLALTRHGAVPGYDQLGRAERMRLNTVALGWFLRSGEAARMGACLAIWVLLAHIARWHADKPPSFAAALTLAAAVWLLPWLAHARRRWLAQLLGNRWPAF